MAWLYFLTLEEDVVQGPAPQGRIFTGAIPHGVERCETCEKIRSCFNTQLDSGGTVQNTIWGGPQLHQRFGRKPRSNAAARPARPETASPTWLVITIFRPCTATVFVKLFVENRAGSSCSITPGSGFATISARSDTSTAAPSVAWIMRRLGTVRLPCRQPRSDWLRSVSSLCCECGP